MYEVPADPSTTNARIIRKRASSNRFLTCNICAYSSVALSLLEEASKRTGKITTIAKTAKKPHR